MIYMTFVYACELSSTVHLETLPPYHLLRLHHRSPFLFCLPWQRQQPSVHPTTYSHWTLDDGLTIANALISTFLLLI